MGALAIWIIPFLLWMWWATSTLLAWSGGWTALARRYRATAKPSGTTFRMQSARFGWVDYNGCLTIRVSAEGVYLELWPILRIGHPALLIPWSALTVLQVRERWWAKDVTLAVETPEIARIRLPLKVVEAAEGLPAAEGDRRIPS